ncbi:beta-phosphoglucomutase [Neptunitalea lumnitzerae]|uniref:Beta-phosphoglucomutase n=1 Tax=Neptunitalea lumnitzerae TaxID=2965509 RepID=A0ABQ5MGJ3_9FLAO|nr:beta-phosphoglucomutase [Neptunitalea sp. Y10]GLB48544.1 beta-phosphoglucomutase [Neptunitalea sp. Y10]
MKTLGLIFDLDGVIVDTAKFHFLAWKKAAEEVGFELTEELNEKLKGVSRVDSLNKILEWAGATVSQEKFDEMAANKNADYLTYVDKMTADDILPGVESFIREAKAKGYPIALGSASKNAPRILKHVGIFDLFDTIADGNSVTKAKPDPEVFQVAAKALNVPYAQCVVFEDSEAGVEAANNTNMLSIGLGSKDVLIEADHVFGSFTEITLEFIETQATTNT